MYLINFTGGTKGDFLTNYLNEHSLKLENRGSNRSLSIYQIDNIQNNNLLIEKFFSFYRDIKFFNSHNCINIDKQIFKKYNIKLIHILATKKNFKTISIENILKNCIFDGINYVLNEKQNRIDFLLKNYEDYYKFQILNDSDKLPINHRVIKETYKRQLSKITYSIDFDLIDNNLEPNDINRYNYVENQLKNIKNYYYTADWFYNSKKTISKKDLILNYEDIYQKYDFTLLKQIDKDFNDEDFLNLLKQTWLPRDFHLFGKKINPYEYGYCNW